MGGIWGQQRALRVATVPGLLGPRQVARPPMLDSPLKVAPSSYSPYSPRRRLPRPPSGRVPRLLLLPKVARRHGH